MAIDPKFIGLFIKRHAAINDVRADIVACIIMQESGGEPFANRFEPGIYRRLENTRREGLAGWKPSEKELPTLVTEKINRSMSYGLMQVLGETARWCAKVEAPFLTTLLDPELGISCGCKVLRFYLDKVGDDYDKALSMYNTGNPDSRQGEIYAKEVMARYYAREHERFQ